MKEQTYTRTPENNITNFYRSPDLPTNFCTDLASYRDMLEHANPRMVQNIPCPIIN